jgi:hypothetical protein
MHQLSRLTTQHPDLLSPTNAPYTTIGYSIGDAIASLEDVVLLSHSIYFLILYSEYFPCSIPHPREGNLQLTADEGHLDRLGRFENLLEFRSRVVPQQLTQFFF